MPFDLHRGTNISHWLSQSSTRGRERRSWFTRDDMTRIADWGFDHVRLPVDEAELWTDGGTRLAESFELLGIAVEWAAAAGLRVIVDLHDLRTHHANAPETPALFAEEAARATFLRRWLDLSEFLRSASTDLVAYELLNEPAAPDPGSWNATWRAVYDEIRDREPERTVVLGSNDASRCRSFPDLDPPDDRALLLTFHYYDPMFITHYTAKWWREGGSYSGPIRYPGRPIPDSQHIAIERLRDEGLEHENRSVDRDVMAADVSVAREVADRHGMVAYCGAFGCYDQTPDDIREAWYRDIGSVFCELDIPWANRDYRGSFGLVDPDGNETGVRAWLMEA